MREKTPKNTRMGRPPKAPADKFSAYIFVRMTPAEKAKILRACSGSSVAEWARRLMLGGAKK